MAKLAASLGRALPPGFEVRTHSPLAVSDDSEPEPDVAVVSAGDYSTRHPQTALLVIEVADSSLQKDRRVKAALYAAAGIPEFWLVDLAGGRRHQGRGQRQHVERLALALAARGAGRALADAFGGRLVGDVVAVVVGVGVNLLAAAYPPELADRATSLETELGRPTEVIHFIVEVLAQLRELARRLGAEDRVWVLSHWRSLASRGLGQAAVHWQDRGITRRGWARDVDEDGALVVERDGRRERIVAGEVTWERLS